MSASVTHLLRSETNLIVVNLPNINKNMKTVTMFQLLRITLRTLVVKYAVYHKFILKANNRNIAPTINVAHIVWSFIHCCSVLLSLNHFQLKFI